MTQLDFDHGLKRDPDLKAQLSKTHKGMAHFAGTGPKGETCRTCVHFGMGPLDYYAASNKTHGPTLKPAPCAKFKSLMGFKGADIPHHASACSHHRKSENPPPIARRA